MDEFKSMKFFDGYFNAIMKLPDDKTKVEVFEAVIRYGLTGEEPSCTGFAAAQFEAFRVSLDSNRQAHKRNIENGRKHRSAHEQEASRTEPTNNPPASHKNRKEIKDKKNKTEKDNSFSVFWSAYPKKKGKAAAEKAFFKADADLALLLTALEAQKQSPDWQKDQGQFIPYPATWLNGKRWLDELEAGPENQPVKSWVPDGTVNEFGEAGGHWE